MLRLRRRALLGQAFQQPSRGGGWGVYPPESSLLVAVNALVLKRLRLPTSEKGEAAGCLLRDGPQADQGLRPFAGFTCRTKAARPSRLTVV